MQTELKKRAAKSDDAKKFYEEELSFHFIIHDGSKLFAGELEMLLMWAREAGSNMELILNRTHLNLDTGKTMSILGKAAATCQYWTLKVLLEQGADANLLVNGMHALHWLCTGEVSLTWGRELDIAIECVCRYMSGENINRAVNGTTALDMLIHRIMLDTRKRKLGQPGIEVLVQHGAERYADTSDALVCCGDSDVDMSSLHDQRESTGSENGSDVEMPPLLPATPSRVPKTRSTTGNASPMVHESHVHQWQIPHTSYIECVLCFLEGYDMNIGTL